MNKTKNLMIWGQGSYGLHPVGTVMYCYLIYLLAGYWFVLSASLSLFGRGKQANAVIECCHETFYKVIQKTPLMKYFFSTARDSQPEFFKIKRNSAMHEFFTIGFLKKISGKLLVFQVLCKTNISETLLKHLLQSSSYFCFEKYFDKDKIPDCTK